MAGGSESLKPIIAYIQQPRCVTENSKKELTKEGKMKMSKVNL